MDNKNNFSRRGFIRIVSSVGAGTLLGCTPNTSRLSSKPKTLPASGSKITLPLRLHSNENPYGPFTGALSAIQNIAGKSNYYASDSKAALKNALAEHYRLNKEQVLLGCGSIELLKIMTEVFCSPALPPVIPEPIFEAIDYYASLSQTHPIKVPLTRDFQHDLDQMAAICLKSEAMVYICNPANPTGTIVQKDAMEQFLVRVPENTIVVVDEAYAEYTDRSDFESCVKHVRRDRPNLVVLRTFSKLYGLAGLRIGYALGPKHLIQAMASHRLWNNVNQAGAAAALASLRDKQSMSIVRQQNARVRQAFYKEVKKLGIQYIPSETSFVMLNVKRPAIEMIPAFRKNQILVGRPIPSLPKYLRITLGTGEEMRYFLKVLKALIS